MSLCFISRQTEMNVSPKKRLGQHFLTDQGIARKISNLVLPECPNIIEIGPGKGILTKQLFDRGLNLKAVDVDEESIEYLNVMYPDHSHEFILGDFLEMDISALFDKDAHFQIIGNYPYNISSQILFKALEYKDYVDCISGMFQKEVAQRIVSPPGSKVYGILSVLLQTWYKCEYCFTVNEGSFFPPPKVKSGVIRLVRNDVRDIGVDEDLYTGIIKTAFNQRRKTLRNSLKGYGLPDMEILARRPETLSPEEFADIASSVR